MSVYNLVLGGNELKLKETVPEPGKRAELFTRPSGPRVLMLLRGISRSRDLRRCYSGAYWTAR